jgi:hypothetical protein
VSRHAHAGHAHGSPDTTAHALPPPLSNKNSRSRRHSLAWSHAPPDCHQSMFGSLARHSSHRVTERAPSNYLLSLSHVSHSGVQSAPSLRVCGATWLDTCFSHESKFSCSSRCELSLKLQSRRKHSTCPCTSRPVYHSRKSLGRNCWNAVFPSSSSGWTFSLPSSSVRSSASPSPRANASATCKRDTRHGWT